VIRKFAENSGKSAGEFYTPLEVGRIISRVLEMEPGMKDMLRAKGQARAQQNS